MEKHGFKGVFFVMTVLINRPNYLTKEQIAALSDTGNVSQRIPGIITE
jgi:peptidoglycan/xylan/chitin deacetylase (PgdA/CDA1 family)